MFIDSHCHLLHTFSDKNEILNYLSDKIKPSYLIDVSTNIEEFLNISSFDLPETVFKAFGLYPENAPAYSADMKSQFEELVEIYNPIAIGEIGLDYHWNYGTKEEQELLFREQIEFAIEKKLPIIVHSRDSFEDTFDILSDYNYSNVIIHCFGYGVKEAEKFLNNGYFISFAGNVTYKNALQLQEACKIVPYDSLLIETDSPYLTPVPKRGRKNRPDYVKYTYEFISNLRGIEIEELAGKVKENFFKAFNIKGEV